MKNLSFFNKVIFFLNSVFGILLLASYLLPFIPPHIFPSLSVLSLIMPVLLVINLIFFLYWLFRGKRQFLLSAFILLLGATHILSLFRINTLEVKSSDTALKILTYNVRQFNINGWSEEVNVVNRISDFVIEKDPDIVAFQEYHPSLNFDRKLYPHQYRAMNKGSKNFGQIIFSKYKIISKGSLDFEKTGNNAIYIDIVRSKDTLRIYNVHFQSLRVSPSLEDLQKQNSKRFIGRLGQSFVKQEQQLIKFLKHEENSPYPVVVAGDFNNSATSYLYRKVRGEKEDAFAKAGSGTGATFQFDIIPLRIDFILADKKLPVLDFKTYDIPLSDHFPSIATFDWK